MVAFTIWRHPQPQGAEGRCIGGRTDLPVDARKAKRLAHRIRAHARRNGLPREVVTSPLRRAADVGRWLKRWGFVWRVDAALRELDFGAWDGKSWHDIPHAEFDRWMAGFDGFDFDGGESLVALLCRAAVWQPLCALAVGHGGWITARAWQGSQTPTPATWPAPLRYGERFTSAPSAA
ncbi:histidine phosphatase family protein [Roseateles sp. DC23W]|uniref:Histidine phosphatase family protein n=1 Tax=Pelomonas dachongensis TaxID=3299029 RepID=A0ABW7EUG4_9BURK